jgi:hypothetical protein
MNCRNCGKELKPGQKFCSRCGTPIFEEQVFAYSEKGEEMEGMTSKQPQSKRWKEKLLIFWAAFLFVALLGACAYYIWFYDDSSGVSLLASTDIESEIEGIPFKSSEKGKWGMLLPDGTVLFEEEFKDAPTVARDGRFMVRNGNGLWEIYTATEMPEKIGDEYIYIGDFYNGVAPAVRKNERISLIDDEGNVLTVLEKSGSKTITAMGNFHYGYAIFNAEDACGIVNVKGQILLDAKKYYIIMHVAPKRFLALDMKYKDEEDYHNIVFDIIDPVGNKKGSIKMSKYDDISPLAEGYMCIEQISDGERLYGIMNLEGEVIVKPTNKIHGILDFRNDLFVFSNSEGLMGIRNVDGKVLIRAKYDAIRWATDDYIWANTSNDGHQEWFLIDLEGNKITNESYQDAKPFIDGKHAFVKITDKTWGIIDNRGEELKNTPDIYSVIGATTDDVIYSDYVDLDVIMAAVKMTPYGFGGFGINMPPTSLIKAYNENCERNSRIEMDPANAHIDKLSYEKEIMAGIKIDVKVYYNEYMTERGESHFNNDVGEWIQEPDRWTKKFPQYVKMTVSGPKLQGKTNLLYKKLAVKAKTYGTVYMENDNACIIVKKNGDGFILVNTGSEVWAMVKGIESLKNERIDQYSNSETRRGPAYDNVINARYYEETIDTIGYY